MRCWLHWSAVVLLLAVAIIFVSPAVDLPETALRAWQAAIIIACALIAVATAVARVPRLSLMAGPWFPPARADVRLCMSAPPAVPLLC